MHCPRLRPVRVFLCVWLLWITACGPTPSGYYPLDEGLRWQYRIIRTVASNSYEQRFEMSNLGSSQRDDGLQVFAQAHNHDFEYFFYDEDGLKRLHEADDPVQKATLILPAENGPNSWPVAERTIIIQSRKKSLNARYSAMTIAVPMDYQVIDRNATTEVPAGSFERCVLVQGSGSRVFENAANDDTIHVSVEARHWYAPGVGLVRSERYETSDSRHLNNASLVLELEQLSL